MALDPVLQQIAAGMEGALTELAGRSIESHPPTDELVSLRLRRSARLPVLAVLFQNTRQPVLLVTDRADHALELYDELSLWLPDVPRLLIPEPNPLFYEKAAWGETTRRDRLAALTGLAAYHIPGVVKPKASPLLVASARAVMMRTMPKSEFLRATRNLQVGQIIQVETLVRSLVRLGYELVNTVVLPGQFARRGGIIDVWPPAAAQPTRLEFFGDEIDTLRTFDPATQRTSNTQTRLLITPAREFLLTDEHLSLQEPEEIFEFHIPQLHQTPACLLDYLPRDAILAIDDLGYLRDTVADLEEQAVELRQSAQAEGLVSEDDPFPYLTWTELAESLTHRRAIELGPSTELASEPGDISAQVEISARFSVGQRYGGRLKPFMEHIAERLSKGAQVTIVSRQSTRLQELWKEQHIQNKSPDYVQGSLSEGWIFYPPDGAVMHLYTDGEIFGWRRPEPRQRFRPAAESPEAVYADLQAGDYIVHVDHGIGIFIGLVDRTLDNIEREYLCIEYANEAQVFVPAHQADRITRYIGSDGRPPTLSRLGSSEWRSTKAHVKEAVQEVAEDLLELYAKRNIIPGHSFATDTVWQQELEASFPYVETEDQMRVLAEVKHDMEMERPMDRLICGDVGYGKTEVALQVGLQSRHGRQAGRHPGPDDRAGAAALPDLPPAPGGLPRRSGDALTLPHPPAAAHDPGTPGRRRHRYRHRHPPPALLRCAIQRPGSADHR